MTVASVGTVRGNDVLAKSLLVIAALSFVFSGFYKGLVNSPLDLTVLTGGLTCAALLPFIREIDVHRHAAAWLLVALAGYLALRLLPDFPAWGVRKLAEFVLFGAPAFLAGYVIAKRDHAVQLTMDALAWSAAPMAIALAALAANTNPYSYQSIGSAGYQLTGLYMGLALIACAASNRFICFGFAALGLAVTGNLSAGLFAPPAVMLIWWTRRRPVLKPLVAALALLSLYTAAVAPPLIVMRTLWKIGSIENKVALGEKAPAVGGAEMTGKVLELMPSESQQYLVETRSGDRLDIFKAAALMFKDSPIFGRGYGTFEHAENRYPHNILLEMLAEGGAIAGLLMIAALAAARPPLNDDESAFAAASLLLLIGSSFVSGYWGNRILLLFLGLCVGRR